MNLGSSPDHITAAGIGVDRSECAVHGPVRACIRSSASNSAEEPGQFSFCFLPRTQRLPNRLVSHVPVWITLLTRPWSLPELFREQCRVCCGEHHDALQCSKRTLRQHRNGDATLRKARSYITRRLASSSSSRAPEQEALLLVTPRN